MAKKPELPRNPGEMNFIMFSLRGGDETLQQSFRTIGQALESAFHRAKSVPLKSTAQPHLEKIQSGVRCVVDELVNIAGLRPNESS